MAIGKFRCIVLNVADLEPGERFWTAVTGLPLRFSGVGYPTRYSRLGDRDDPRARASPDCGGGSDNPGGVMHMQGNTAYRFAWGLALTASFLIVWLNAAAGLIGIEDDDPANLLYVGVLAIGFTGAVIARFRPLGLARACFATALAQALVAAIALKLPNTASSVQIVSLHAVFVALFAGAALLFRYSAQKGFRPGAGATG